MAGENGGPLRHRPDVPGEPEGFQILQKFGAETIFAPQVGDVLLVKAQLFDIVDDLLQPRRNGEAAPVGDVAEENVKIADLLVHSRLKISVAHGELVEIAEQGVIHVFFHVFFHVFTTFNG